uniref:Uncharacterized protein n=1 Tax=Astyanax mexicanus TaxID=7994 RepID=A0A8B9GUX5_ASTMX
IISAVLCSNPDVVIFTEGVNIVLYCVIFDYLLNHRANPDIQDKRGKTPVILSAELGHEGMVALLAQYHANMNVEDNEGKGKTYLDALIWGAVC